MRSLLLLAAGRASGRLETGGALRARGRITGDMGTIDPAMDGITLTDTQIAEHNQHRSQRCDEIRRVHAAGGSDILARTACASSLPY